MKLEQINTTNLTFEEAIKNRDSLYYIVEGDSDVNPFKFLSFSKEGLSIPTDNYILVKITETSDKKTTSSEEQNKPVVVKKKGRGVDRDYKFTGLNDTETIRIDWSIAGNKYGGIRVSFPNKEDAKPYYDYFREQFYSRDISSINVSSIYEDLGISKDRIEKECPNAWKWGYPTLFNGPCKYLTELITKNKNDTWYGFTFTPPMIINGMEESGWYAKQKELATIS